MKFNEAKSAMLEMKGGVMQSQSAATTLLTRPGVVASGITRMTHPSNLGGQVSEFIEPTEAELSADDWEVFASDDDWEDIPD